MDFNKTFLIFEMSHENKKTRSKAIGQAAQIMNHLLKCKYSSERNITMNHWSVELIAFRDSIKRLQDKISRKSYNLEKDMNRIGMEDSYKEAKILYKNACHEDKTLPDMKNLNLPVSCPWTFQEIMSERIENLILKLP